MNKMWNRKKGIIILAALLLCAVGIGMFVVVRRPPAEGIPIYPMAEWSSPNPVYYTQNNQEWGEERMGEASDTLAKSGCLVTCLASSMEMQMSVKDASYHMTPERMNAEFSENGVYDGRANILWNPLKEYLTDWTVSLPSNVNAGEIEKMLQDGRYPIVKVHMPVSGANHWVLLMGARNGEYYCMDPLNDGREMVPLSKFANTVYSVRSISR